MRKGLFLLNATIVGVLVFVSACSNSSSVKDAEAPITNDSIVVSPAGTFPIVNEKVMIKALIKGNSRVEEFATNLFTKEYEEKTNVHIEWEVAPEKNFKEKLNLVLASGDLPDVIIDMGLSPTQQMVYGKQGLFLPLNAYIEKYGVEMKKIFQDIPEVKEKITAPDGNIYSLPQVADCFHCRYSQRMWIYKPWLDKLGLTMPQTTEEYYQVLKAFKEKDPNGNGKADEIPLTTGIVPGGGGTLESMLMNSFLYNNQYNENKYLSLNKGKVDFAANKPEWQEGLKYLRKLYADKLIDPESFTQDLSQLKKLAENPDVPLVGSVPLTGLENFTQVEGKSGRWAEYVMLPPLKGPGGVQLASYDYYNQARIGRFTITKKAKYPEVAYRWVDALYENDMSLRSVDGREGTEWRRAKEDEKGIDGRKASWGKLQPFGTVQNIAWAQSVPSYRSDKLRMSMAVFKQPELEVILYQESKNKYQPYIQSKEVTLPPLFFEESQASEITDLKKTIEDYVTVMMAAFITGDKDITKEWDNYVKTLDGMNLKRYLEINQAAYDILKKK
jgi:putative aldouronate transport system substrate-binding protein